jgi:AraC-like DNA-binding protein
MNQTKTFYEQQIERIASNHGLPAYQYIQVRQSKAFMDKYYGEKIELAKMAASAFMSRFHYIRIFGQVYGLTPRHYLRDLRLSKAKELLKKGLSVTQVCFEVGYESVPTFSAAFKKASSYSPAAYQKIHHSNRE